MTDNGGVLLTNDELQELVDIRCAIDGFFKMLDASTESLATNDAAAVLQPINAWLGDFVDKLYKRAG
jgi:hypothetical protein